MSEPEVSRETCTCRWHEFFPTAWEIKQVNPECELHGRYAPLRSGADSRGIGE